MAESIPNSLEVMITGGLKIFCWEASTAKDRAEGARKFPLKGYGTGILFSSFQEQYPHFWNMGVAQDIDIAFVGLDRKVFSVHSLKAGSTDILIPSSPVRYALEMKGGAFQKVPIVVGTSILQIVRSDNGEKSSAVDPVQ